MTGAVMSGGGEPGTPRGSHIYLRGYALRLLVSEGLMAFAILLFLIGFSSNEWFVSTAPSEKVNFGLWNTCSYQCVAISPIGDHLALARALEVLGLLSMLVSTLMALVQIKFGQQGELICVGIVSSLLSALGTGLGAILYDCGVSSHLVTRAWGFHITMMSSLIAAVCTALHILAIYKTVGVKKASNHSAMDSFVSSQPMDVGRLGQVNKTIPQAASDQVSLLSDLAAPSQVNQAPPQIAADEVSFTSQQEQSDHGSQSTHHHARDNSRRSHAADGRSRRPLRQEASSQESKTAENSAVVRTSGLL